MPINRAPWWRVQEGCRSLITVPCNTHCFVQGWGGAAQLLLSGWRLHQPYTPFIVPRHADPGQWHSLTRYLAFWDRDREPIHLAVLTLVWQGSSYSCKTSTRPLQQLYKQGAVKIKIKRIYICNTHHSDSPRLQPNPWNCSQRLFQWLDQHHFLCKTGKETHISNKENW